MPSQITHTQSFNIHHLAHILDTYALIFSSCAIFTVYPNRIMLLHPTPLQVITTRTREGSPKDHRANQNWQRETQSVTYVCTRALHSFLSSAHCRAAYTVIPLLPPKATFTPSIQPNLGLPRIRPQLTSAINTLLAIRYSSIFSTCPDHLIRSTR